jgi:hypothetical protein
MRRRIALAALCLGLPAVAASAAEALPAIPAVNAVSVNRAPVSVNHLPTPGNRQADRQANSQAERRRANQARRRELVRRWSGVAECESGGNWRTNTGNGYYGGLQFSLSTWRAYGGRGRPDQRPPWYQAGIAERVRRDSGLGHWPNCGRYYRS